jgi:Spy/CpxP family protein refolding chaperone
MRRFLVASACVIMLSAAGLQAQAAKPSDDPLAKLLFPPELVLKHAQDLGLQPAQRTTIVSAIKEAQGDMLDLQLEMAERAQALVKLMDVPRVDEASALAQADKVLGLERDMKRKQLQLLVRIKNALTPEQQERLRNLRARDGNGGDLE